MVLNNECFFERESEVRLEEYYYLELFLVELKILGDCGHAYPVILELAKKYNVVNWEDEDK